MLTAVTTDVEDGVEVAGLDVGELHGVLPQSLLLGEELLGDGVGLEHLY